ncbi:hypothetical protein TraAM80_08542 [Trypanosoma rangeli]|uniref:Uncharacterized protein n=1 Tax=Trypanosoma rangeli TaxID=5698 RepID=A0A422N0B9_TRYRA|nr:uncharacterized protein TraAM80_08542 [Trypanosoma rangeli]RNE98904.1 hypothetical protein TraAM80_08542 [Trypanosoma rangeli]|eukprot:RNE98904.1 hypothetical protein TraAM80_08542 [Trypanosoma rangeli]
MLGGNEGCHCHRGDNRRGLCCTPRPAPPEVEPIMEATDDDGLPSSSRPLFWEHVGKTLGVEGVVNVGPLLPLAVCALVKSQNPSWVVGGSDTAGRDGDGAGVNMAASKAPSSNDTGDNAAAVGGVERTG